MKVAVVGATGMVGTVMLQVLEERNFPIEELLPRRLGTLHRQELNVSRKRGPRGRHATGH